MRNKFIENKCYVQKLWADGYCQKRCRDSEAEKCSGNPHVPKCPHCGSTQDHCCKRGGPWVSGSDALNSKQCTIENLKNVVALAQIYPDVSDTVADFMDDFHERQIREKFNGNVLPFNKPDWVKLVVKLFTVRNAGINAAEAWHSG